MDDKYILTTSFYEVHWYLMLNEHCNNKRQSLLQNAAQRSNVTLLLYTCLAASLENAFSLQYQKLQILVNSFGMYHVHLGSGLLVNLK